MGLQQLLSTRNKAVISINAALLSKFTALAFSNQECDTYILEVNPRMTRSLKHFTVAFQPVATTGIVDCHL